MDLVPDTWYQKLSIQFEDGTTEVLYIERRSTGTHIPRVRAKPESWTKLSFQKCPCCPLPDFMPRCPAALSLQTTMSKLRPRKSIERVKAKAVDARGRSQTIEGDLQTIGSTLVQLAVFASDCPVGHRLKPCLVGLPPFIGSLELSRRIAAKILEKHGGSADAARAELTETLAPLPVIFLHLARRISADEQNRPRAAGVKMDPRDAVPNAITQVDAFAQLLARRAGKLFAELTIEIGWGGGKKKSPGG